MMWRRFRLCGLLFKAWTSLPTLPFFPGFTADPKETRGPAAMGPPSTRTGFSPPDRTAGSAPLSALRPLRPQTCLFAPLPMRARPHRRRGGAVPRARSHVPVETAASCKKRSHSPQSGPLRAGPRQSNPCHSPPADESAQQRLIRQGHLRHAMHAHRPLNRVPKMPRTMRRPVVPFSSFNTMPAIASPKLSDLRDRLLRADREDERPTRGPE